MLTVAADPAASFDPYHVPLLPNELAAVAKSDASADSLLPVVRDYADDFPGFAGAWLDSPRVAVAFTDATPERLVEIHALFGDHVLVRVAEFDLTTLQDHVRTIRADSTWFVTAGTKLIDASADVAQNRVQVHVPYPDPAAEASVRAHFGDSGWMVFAYDGPAPWTGPLGGLHVTIRDEAGAPVAAQCLLATNDPRVQDETTVYSEGGECFFDDLPAVAWTLRIDYDLDGNRKTINREYTIPANEVTQDVVTAVT
ncbi:MAG TPA: hypothetical protein VFI15_00120 [Candidatus Limnocylindrales bacterium]|nr:hypothetical protein [Candidatus Limnocylindrales bacterium]